MWLPLGAGLPTPPKRPTAGLLFLFTRHKKTKCKEETFGRTAVRGHLPEDTRGILSNCACLGERVDVPVLDGV